MFPNDCLPSGSIAKILRHFPAGGRAISWIQRRQAACHLRNHRRKARPSWGAVFVATWLLCCAQCSLLGQQKHTFAIANSQFMYDGKAVQIHSGEMHFARIPRQYWRHRLQMLKAMGLNTVATYVFWNYHETAPGVWDFKTGNHDIAAFIRTAQEVGLFVILRPGPYACAEWEFGGYPWWLEKDTGLVIRTYNQPFLDSCNTYIRHLAAQVKDLQITHGGPIIMVQAENEFGSYVAQRKDIPAEQHTRYKLAIEGLLKQAGFDIPLFTSDGSWLFNGGAIEGILPAANGEDNVDSLKKAVDRYHHQEGPYMVAEFYPGWLDHWGEPFANVTASDVVGQLEKYLKAGVSFNIYMVHGGTNFGFTSGANYDGGHDIQPDLTSYDYDAPINEQGWATPKYIAIRELLKRYVKNPFPPIPKQIPAIALPPIQLHKSVDLFSLKSAMQPVASDSILTFEDLNQGYGYVLYSRKFTESVKGTLVVDGLRDYATVYVNRHCVGILNRVMKKYSLPVDIPDNATLDILVENMGRINYGAEIVHNTKGIISPVMINNQKIEGHWKMYRFPFASMPVIRGTESGEKTGQPAIYGGSFLVETPGDIFLNMKKWDKGIVFVNGWNLGRYWKVGPQQTLYLPGAFLKKGKNEIAVFEQINEGIIPSIPTASQPVLTTLQQEKYADLIQNVGPL